jgi:Sulfotransferase family
MRLAKERRSHVSLRAILCFKSLFLCGLLLSLILSLSSISVELNGRKQNVTISSRKLHQRRLPRGTNESLVPISVPKRTAPVKQSRDQNPNGGAFVHTGKTGGSTISVLLRNGCHSFMPHPCRTNITHESLASQLIESYYHVPDFGLLRESNHSFYVITSRDPFDRTISAFVYDHIQNRYARNETISEFKKSKYLEAYRCFPSLQSYVEHLGERPDEFRYPHKRNWVTAESCADLAKAALHSRVKIYNHLYFSLMLLLSYTPVLEKQILYTIRQEHLWDDWKSLNEALGQTESMHLPKHQGFNQLRNVAALELEKKVPVTRDLDQAGRALLCNALREEYRAYFYLLTHAKNLSPNDVQQSITRSKQNCPNLNLPYSTYVT